MRLLYVPLSQQEREALIDLARAQHRRPQDQAAYLLGQILRCEEAPLGEQPEATRDQEQRLEDERERVAV
jgi:hypothetical protein